MELIAHGLVELRRDTAGARVNRRPGHQGEPAHVLVEVVVVVDGGGELGQQVGIASGAPQDLGRNDCRHRPAGQHPQGQGAAAVAIPAGGAVGRLDGDDRLERGGMARSGQQLTLGHV